MNLERNQFRLDIRLDGKPPMKIDVVDVVTAGLDPRSDLVLVGQKIRNRHLEFSLKGENLALLYLGNTNQTFLNSLPLEEGKTYLLEADDRIQLSGAEIIIMSEVVHVHSSQAIKPVLFPPLSDLTPESLSDKIIYADNPTGSMRREIPVRPKFILPKEKNTLLSLWLVKCGAIFFDFFATYLLLTVLLPLLSFHKYALALSEGIAELVFPAPMNTSSFFKFFFFWYFLSLAQSMILGTTFGQFILGLRRKGENKFGALILFRLKTLLFSLFLLPAQNALSPNPFFKGMRKVGFFLISLFIIFSPFFLPPPFNISLTLMNNEDSPHRELRTRSLFSYSVDMKVALNAELSFRYLLLPYFEEEDRRAFDFIDLKNKSRLLVKEDKNFSYDEIEKQIQYANPFYSFLSSRPFAKLSLQEKKEKLKVALLSNPKSIKDLFVAYGPFFGGSTLLKALLTESIETNEATVKLYGPSSPMFFIGSSSVNYFYLFTPKGLKRFSVYSPKKNSLISVFEEQVWSKLLLETENAVVLNRGGINVLEAQEAFLHGIPQALLTYYISIANNLSNARIIHAEMDLTENAQKAVARNIETLIKHIQNKNIVESLADIKEQLTPMEIPGETR